MFGLESSLQEDEGLVYVQEEPALEIALPQVFEQPTLSVVQRGKLPHVEALVAKIYRAHVDHPEEPLGRSYQEIVNEFQPFFSWTTACWDYLLSTEGCRFVLRNGLPRIGVRGDYRAVTSKDYSRLVHLVFRHCVFEFAQQPEAPSLREWLRENLWPRIREAYCRMDQPADPLQRTLSPYSYLRCVPYEFLNPFHHELVHTTLKRLPFVQRQAIDAYFFHFYTELATAQQLGSSIEECRDMLRQGLMVLLVHHKLVYCLLRQIERY